MILPTSDILSLNEAFSRRIFPQELWNKIANGKQHFSVLFVKRTTGELRNITHATMNVQKMLDRNPNSQGRSIKMSDFDLLFIRDNSQYDANGIQGVPRSIPLENIIQIKCGKIYDFKKVNNIPYFFPKFKNATLAKSDSDNIILVEEKTMKKLNNDNLKMVVENVVKKLLREASGQLDTSFLQEYENYFQQLQFKYNQFFKQNHYSYAEFYNIMQVCDELTKKFTMLKNQTLGTIYDLPEHIYDQNDNYYLEIENKIGEINKRIDLFNSEIEKATNALKQLDDVEYTLNIF